MKTCDNSTWEKIHEEYDCGKKIVIVGAGRRGINFASRMKNEGIKVFAFMDNSEELQHSIFNAIKVLPLKYMEDCFYAISVKSRKASQQLSEQLETLGVAIDNILYLELYESQGVLTDKNVMKDEISAMYFSRYGRQIDWDHPTGYNEKINVEKVNRDFHIEGDLVDKLKVKEYIRTKIGEEYVVKLLGSWEDSSQIDFSSLPSQFVLKTNNGSKRNIIVKDKTQIDEDEVRKKLEMWLKENYSKQSYEMQYAEVVPMILCEEYLDGVADTVYEYDVFCFHGKAKYIWCINGSHKSVCKASFYDTDWNKQDFSYGYPIDEEDAPKPDKLNEMLHLSEKLASDFDHVRVDWFIMPDGRLLFGEMTFSTWAGMAHFEPDEYDSLFGNFI